MRIYDATTAERYDDSLGYTTQFGAYKLSVIAERFFEISYMDPTKNVLEIASGTGELAIRYAKKANDVVCIDISEYMVNIAKRKAEDLQIKTIKFAVGDALSLPFKDNTFDIVMERGISLLFYDKFLEDGTAQNVLEEMKRVSNDKVVIIHEAKSPLLLFKQKRSPYHYFTGKELKRLLEKIGLKDVRVQHITHSVPLLFNLLGAAKLKRVEWAIQDIPLIKCWGGYNCMW